MRNIYCGIADMRKQVFAEVARLAYEGGDYHRVDKLPHKILPDEPGNERDSIFLERAIVAERIRLAMGHSLRSASHQEPLSDAADKTAIRERYYEPPLINIIKYACHACPDTHYEVSNACQSCLARHCSNACPKGAISFLHGRAEIDQNKCIKCGKCKAACSYQAIIRFERPCQEACVTPGQFVEDMKILGFQSVKEVAIGADLCAIEEAEEFMAYVPAKQPYMATSCCPAWSVMAKKEFPGAAPYISMTMTPMVLTARLQKKRDPDCKVAFIGPCAAKKLEACRRSVRSDVDFVLTFEELRGMMEAKDIDFAQIPDVPANYEASAPGVGFAASGGVAKAVEDVIHRLEPDREVKTVYAEGLRECRKMLRIARTGKYDGYLLEGMACPGGCIAGAGTIQPPEKSRRVLEQYKASAPKGNPLDSDYKEDLYLLHGGEDDWSFVGRH